jgi:opacity protein-like surface antigen
MEVQLMKRSTIFDNAYTRLFTAIAVVLVVSTTALAQVEQHSQISVQGMGLIAKDTTSDTSPLSQQSTKSGGGLVGYSYQFNRWAGAEGNYGYTRNTVNTFGNFGQSSIRSDFHEVTGAFVAHIPVRARGVRPYALAGAGALIFNPTDEAKAGNAGIDRQAKATFVYGGGVNFDVTHFFGIRAEYRGLMYKASDFKLEALNLDKMTHLAQPSVGMFFRF